MPSIARAFHQGLAADKPTADATLNQGWLYFETDTGKLMQSWAGVWVQVNVDPTPTALFPTVLAHSAAGATIANATMTYLPFDTTDYDSGVPGAIAQHELITHPSRLTCQVDGVYSISLFVGYASNATGLRYVNLRKNGDNTKFLIEDGRAALIGDVSEFALGAQRSFVAGDYIEMGLWQNSGGDLGLRTDSGLSPHLGWTRLTGL